MADTIEAIKTGLDTLKNAWDKKSGEGRDEKAARDVAEQLYVNYPEAFEGIQNKSLAELADMCSQYRAAGNDYELAKVEAFLLYRYPPQDIGGTVQVMPRKPIAGEAGFPNG